MACAYSGIGDTSAYELKPYQVQEWIDSHGDAWGKWHKDCLAFPLPYIIGVSKKKVD